MVYYFCRTLWEGQGMVQLRIQYDRVADGLVEYTMKTTIEQTTSDPAALDKCLVVRKGDSGTEESLRRVGSYAEVVTSPKPDLPADVDVFYSPSLSTIVGGILNGDQIEILTIPFLWAQHFGVVGPFLTLVTDDAFASNTVKVGTPFPAFARNLVFRVTRGGAVVLPPPVVPPALTTPNPIDGVANRDYTPFGVSEFLASAHADTWDNIDEADGRYLSLRIEAQSLVDLMKQDNYTSQSDEVYE
jgi:hypothetical protein